MTKDKKPKPRLSKNYRAAIRICNKLDLDDSIALLKLIGDQKGYEGPNWHLIKALCYRVEALAPTPPTLGD